MCYLYHYDHYWLLSRVGGIIIALKENRGRLDETKVVSVWSSSLWELPTQKSVWPESRPTYHNFRSTHHSSNSAMPRWSVMASVLIWRHNSSFERELMQVGWSQSRFRSKSWLHEEFHLKSSIRYEGRPTYHNFRSTHDLRVSAMPRWSVIVLVLIWRYNNSFERELMQVGWSQSRFRSKVQLFVNSTYNSSKAL